MRKKHSQADRGFDLYETPACAVASLIQHEKLPHGLWESSCGRGAIAEVLLDAGHAVYCTDLVDRGYIHQAATGDFLKSTGCPQGVDGIVMNPPYAWAALHVRHALRLCPYVVTLLPLAFLEAGNSKTESGRARLFCLDHGHLARVLVFRERLPFMHRDGWAGPRASSNTPFAWFVFDGDHQGDATVKRISWKSAARIVDDAPVTGA